MTHAEESISGSETSEINEEPVRPDQIGFWAIVGILLLIGATHMASQFILDGGMPMLLVSSVVLGAITYQYIIEGHMFIRRAVADSGLKEDTAAHRWLSKGSCTKLIIFVFTVVFSASFLLHANQMPLYMWVIIYLDVLIIAGLLRLTRRQVAAQTKASASGLIGRQYVFWLNLFVLTLLICVVGFFIPVADLRDFSLIESFTMAWSPIWQHTPNPVLAAWAGIIAGLDAVVWNIMQQISQRDISAPLKFTGWVVFFCSVSGALSVAHPKRHAGRAGHCRAGKIMAGSFIG